MIWDYQLISGLDKYLNIQLNFLTYRILRHHAPSSLFNQSIRYLAQYAHQVAEGAGAAATAAAVKLKDQLKKKTVVGILSGGNLPLARFATVLTE